MTTTRYAYPVELETDEDGCVVAYLPDLPGAVTDGRDRAEALAEAVDCLEEALAEAIGRNRPIPPPSPARGRPLAAPGALIAAKAAFYEALAESGLSGVALAATRPRCGACSIRATPPRSAASRRRWRRSGVAPWFR